MATAFDLWEAQMNWIGIEDLLWLAGALFAAGFIVYGVWLCMMEPEADWQYAPDDARPRGAASKATPLTRQRYDAAQRYEAARRATSAASRRTALS